MNREIGAVLAVFLLSALFSFVAFSQDKSEYTVLVKSANGRVLIYNGKNIFFTIELKGENIGQTSTIFQMFLTVDGRPLQIHGLPIGDFMKGGTANKASANAILEKHRDWEVNYLSEVFGKDLNVTSEFVHIAQDRDALLWGFAMPKDGKLNGNAMMSSLSTNHCSLWGFPVIGQKVEDVQDQFYLTTISNHHVVLINCAIKGSDTRDAAKAFLMESLSTLNVSDKPIDVKAVQKAAPR